MKGNGSVTACTSLCEGFMAFGLNLECFGFIECGFVFLMNVALFSKSKILLYILMPHGAIFSFIFKSHDIVG